MTMKVKRTLSNLVESRRDKSRSIDFSASDCPNRWSRSRRWRRVGRWEDLRRWLEGNARRSHKKPDDYTRSPTIAPETRRSHSVRGPFTDWAPCSDESTLQLLFFPRQYLHYQKLPFSWTLDDPRGQRSMPMPERKRITGSTWDMDSFQRWQARRGHDRLKPSETSTTAWSLNDRLSHSPEVDDHRTSKDPRRHQPEPAGGAQAFSLMKKP